MCYHCLLCVSHGVHDRFRACNEFDDTFNRFHLKSYHISEHRDEIHYKIGGIGKRLRVKEREPNVRLLDVCFSGKILCTVV